MLAKRSLVVGLLLGLGLARAPAALAVEEPARPDGYRISGPYSYDNLAVYLLHGKGTQEPGRKLLTLAEALAGGDAVVHETGEVNELAVENLSAGADIYIQAGDIVKGGKQDRVLSVDLVLPPGSGPVPIDAFCVEHGRWVGRSGESASRFDSADSMLASKDLKLAARVAKSQQEVWEQVAAAQEKLSGVLAEPVTAESSPTSLQLSLENTELKALSEAYAAALGPVVEAQPDALGFVFAVNGRISGGEAYASPALFRKLWRKLLTASAVEAVAERGGQALAAPAPEAVAAFLAAPAAAPVRNEPVSERISIAVSEADGAVLLETRDAAQVAPWLHRSYLAR